MDGACEAFYEWKKHKSINIMTFRDNAYKSVITGTMAPVHHTPWKDPNHLSQGISTVP